MSINRILRTALLLAFAIVCGSLAIFQPAWIAELQAQGYLSFSGQVEKLGTTNAKVVIEKELTVSSSLGDLRQAWVTINHVINENGLDLAAGANLPRTLLPSRGGKATEVIFRTPSRVRPQFSLELKNRGAGLYTFRLVLEFADSILPGLCAGSPRGTQLATSMTISGPEGTVPVTALQTWRCSSGDSQLTIHAQLPACTHDLCVEGETLNASCDQCAATICASDPFCCNVLWDNLCVVEVGSLCGLPCNVP